MAALAGAAMFRPQETTRGTLLRRKASDTNVPGVSWR